MKGYSYNRKRWSGSVSQGIVMAVCLAFAAAPGFSQQPEPEVRPLEEQNGISGVAGEEPIRMEEVAVTATRSEESIAAIPGAVTVITREQIEEQATLSRDPAEALGKLVPGLAPGNQSLSSFGQTLRGRNVLVLIDGVPQISLRNAFRDLTAIDLSAVERIEVIRGATAIYGEGASGGIVNIITRRPGEGKTRFTTELGVNTSLSHLHLKDSLGGRIRQEMSGGRGRFDYTLSGSFERTGGFFDAEGDRIPPELLSAQGGLSDLKTYNLFGKFGLDLGPQRLQLTVNRHHARQDTDDATDPAVNAFPPRTVKARAREGLVLADQPETENTVVSLDYDRADLFGSRLHGQLFFRDYLTRFFPSDARASARLGNSIIQSWVESEKIGGRLDIETSIPLPRVTAPTLLWGVDYTDEEAFQPVAIMDPAAFDNSGGLVFIKTGERMWVPPMTRRNLALFGQMEWAATERWLLRAGLRHEWIGIRVDEFTTLEGNTIPGGDIDFSATVFNTGAVFYATDPVSLFVSFSQGFSVPDVGLILRSAPPGFSLESSLLEPIKVDQYEVGARGTWPRIQSSVSAFLSKSDLGITTTGGPTLFNITTVRTPEEIRGIEGTIDIQPLERWSLGGTASWAEGENDPDRDGDFTDMDGFRIPPLKLTAYVEHDTLPRLRWRNRLQILYVGSRDPGLGERAFGGRAVNNYATADWTSSMAVGPGDLRFGIENLFNRQYFTTVSQLLRTGRNDSFTAARGATLHIAYTMTY